MIFLKQVQSAKCKNTIIKTFHQHAFKPMFSRKEKQSNTFRCMFIILHNSYQTCSMSCKWSKMNYNVLNSMKSNKCSDI